MENYDKANILFQSYLWTLHIHLLQFCKNFTQYLNSFLFSRYIYLIFYSSNFLADLKVTETYMN